MILRHVGHRILGLVLGRGEKTSISVVIWGLVSFSTPEYFASRYFAISQQVCFSLTTRQVSATKVFAPSTTGLI